MSHAISPCHHVRSWHVDLNEAVDFECMSCSKPFTQAESDQGVIDEGNKPADEVDED